MNTLMKNLEYLGVDYLSTLTDKGNTLGEKIIQKLMINETSTHGKDAIEALDRAVMSHNQELIVEFTNGMKFHFVDEKT